MDIVDLLVMESCEILNKAAMTFTSIGTEGGEVVTYSGSLPNWVTTWIVNYGFVLGEGSSSDVAYFTKDTGTANVNFSVGYHNEHTEHEILHIDEVELTIKRVSKMLHNLPKKRQMQNSADRINQKSPLTVRQRVYQAVKRVLYFQD